MVEPAGIPCGSLREPPGHLAACRPLGFARRGTVRRDCSSSPLIPRPRPDACSIPSISGSRNAKGHPCGAALCVSIGGAGGNPLRLAARASGPPRGLQAARIREARNSPQGLFLVPAHPASASGRVFDSLDFRQSKRKGPPLRGSPLRFDWWSRRESNPRPKVFYGQFYVCSDVIVFSLPLRRRTGSTGNQPPIF